MRWLKDPLIHFLLIGACIYGAYGLFAGEAADDEARTVTLTQGDIQALTDQWTRLWNRPPTEQELAGVMRNHVRTQILYREAKAMGLERGDTVIERRLAQKVELLSRGLVTPPEPSDEQLASWYAQNGEQFRQADSYTLNQVFFDPDQRGDATLDDARTTLATLQALGELPEALDGYGDSSMLQNYYPGRTELEIRKTFGSGFAEQVITLEPRQWHGPILSGFGAHLVYIDSVTRAAQPELADIREQVSEAWMLEQVNTLSEQFIDELLSRYEIVVEETSVAMTVPPEATPQ